jgi:hypothetical protein
MGRPLVLREMKEGGGFLASGPARGKSALWERAEFSQKNQRFLSLQRFLFRNDCLFEPVPGQPRHMCIGCEWHIPPQEKPMIRKALFALAAVATVGAAALAPTAASAKPFKHWHGHHGYYGLGIGAGLVGAAIASQTVYGSCWVKRWVDTPYGPRLRRVYVCY